jgi:hypothetical protein
VVLSRRFVVALFLIAACGGEEDATTATSTSSAATGGGGGTSDGGGGSGGSGGSTSSTGGGGQGGAMAGDADEDGLDDAVEAQIAADSFPFLAVNPQDGCPLNGVVYRLRPHPADASLVTITYDVLFQNDCGSNGHVGDDEVFGVVVDPSMPAPASILALRAISHQGTPCEHTTSCGTLANCNACPTGMKNGTSYPAVFPSKDKHGLYVDEAVCDQSFICDLGGCQMPGTSDDVPLVNAGEPRHPLVNDLTAQGFITAAEGWTEPELMNFDPWGGMDFGGAGNVTGDLNDAAFVIDPGGC